MPNVRKPVLKKDLQGVLAEEDEERRLMETNWDGADMPHCGEQEMGLGRSSNPQRRGNHAGHEMDTYRTEEARQAESNPAEAHARDIS